MPSDSSSSDHFVTKKIIADRYGVSVRTINTWMRRRLIPYLKPSERTVRFDPALCDIAIRAFEFKSIFDQTIREELGRTALENGDRPLRIAGELGITPIGPEPGQRDGSAPRSKT
jgi:hypothetical protein